MSSPLQRGSCLCGRTTYELAAESGQTLLCHCEDCRRASGAPVVAWTFFPAESLRWTGEAPKTFSFAGRQRSFCPHCGSPLSFFDPRFPTQIEVTTNSLLLPQAHTPTQEDWLPDRLPWMPPLVAKQGLAGP